MCLSLAIHKRFYTAPYRQDFRARRIGVFLARLNSNMTANHVCTERWIPNCVTPKALCPRLAHHESQVARRLESLSRPRKMANLLPTKTNCGLILRKSCRSFFLPASLGDGTCRHRCGAGARALQSLPLDPSLSLKYDSVNDPHFAPQAPSIQ